MSGLNIILGWNIQKDIKKAYCFPCFILKDAWISEGFNSWKRVGGKDSSLRLHEGGLISLHANNVVMLEGFKNPSHNIAKQMSLQSDVEVKNNRLRVITSVNVILYLACQGCALRRNDASFHSTNRGNFIQLLKYTANLNSKIASVILENAPGNVIYTSPKVQNNILDIMSDLVRKRICEEIGDSKFCILVYESQDQSNCEKMAMVIRFVDKEGFIRERFFVVVAVEDTTSKTLKKICSIILDHNGLLVQNIRGQGYDGASNMRGAWSGLLFLQEYPYAYYVHCFAHRLQLALVAASGERTDIDFFFQMLNCIVNLVRASPKRNQSLRLAQRNEITMLIEKGELKTGKGANQKTTLRRPASTRWSSHYSSACSLLDLYNPISKVLDIIQNDSLKGRMRSEASGAFKAMKKIKFVFILHLMIEVMGITEVLCQALQKKNQDVLSGMNCIAIIKTLVCDLKKDDKWKSFLQTVVIFCTSHGIIIPDMNACYVKGTSWSCQQRDKITVEHYYRFDILHDTVDTQVMELTERFSHNTIKFLNLISVLDPRNSFKSFNIDDLCVLAKKYYLEDFTGMEINHELQHQLQHYEH